MYRQIHYHTIISEMHKLTFVYVCLCVIDALCDTGFTEKIYLTHRSLNMRIHILMVSLVCVDSIDGTTWANRTLCENMGRIKNMYWDSVGTCSNRQLGWNSHVCTQYHFYQHYNYQIRVGVNHNSDVIMSVMASQLSSLMVVYLTVYSGTDQRKHQSFASLAFVWGLHWGLVNSPHKGPVTRKMFPFDDVIMLW